MSHEDIHGCRFAVDGKPCGKSADWVAQGGEYPLYVELCAKHYDKLDEEPAGWKERTFQRTKVEVDCTFCDLGQAYPSGPYAPHSPTCPLMRDPLLRKINQEVNRAHGDFLNGPREGECDLDTSAPAAAGGGANLRGVRTPLRNPRRMRVARAIGNGRSGARAKRFTCLLRTTRRTSPQRSYVSSSSTSWATNLSGTTGPTSGPRPSKPRSRRAAGATMSMRSQ